MSWVGKLKSSTSEVPAQNRSDPREDKRKKLEAERLQRAQKRAAIQKQISDAKSAREEANEALEALLDIDPEIFEGESTTSEVPSDILDASLETMVNFDQQNEDDDANAFSNARDCKIPFNAHDIKLWFSLVESKMQFAGIKKQWSKRQVLVQLIPPEYHSDFRQSLQLQETEAGASPYYDLKRAIVKQLGPKKADNFDKAISRVMTGTPSQLGKQILNDICPAVKPLTSCHCADTVLGIWRRSLPGVVRNQIADMDFDSTTYSAVFDKADNVWASSKASTSVVSALAKATAAVDVAATSASGRGRGRNRGSGRGAANNPQNSSGGRGRGPRHPDGPPSGSCSLHWKFGKAAWVCADKHNCPWREFENPRPRHNRNIVASAEINNIED